MSKIYTEKELRDMGMNEEQIKAILNTYTTEKEKDVKEELNEKEAEALTIPTESKEPLVPTSLGQLATYKKGMVVELPPFADGQPFVARMARPSMLGLIRSGKIPNSLLNQATSIFANGAGALNDTGKNATTAEELFNIIDVIAEAALLEPTLEEIRSVGMDLSDDQLMAIFSYTQQGVKALEQFRTK